MTANTVPNVAQALATAFLGLREHFEGELLIDDTTRRLYSTDASAYQEMPTAVAIPKTENDLKAIIKLANEFKVGLIPRTAGTSLAGQVVGTGIVVDMSRHFTEILEINAEEHWVRVQPGVIRNELNMALKPHGLLFGPETSTANRAMLGGMLGNNSCGSNSIKFGSTRDHTLEIRGFLSDGTEAIFGPLTQAEFEAKCEGDESLLETQIYCGVRDLLSDSKNREEIRKEYPKPSIPRRNTGYALDLLMDSAVFGESDKPFDFCKLLAGSEGTLFFATEIKLNCIPLPPPETGLLCAHFETVSESLRATLLAVEHGPYACELIDHYILDGAARNIEQRANSDFVQGKPGAILVTEIRGETREEVEKVTSQIASEMQAAGLGYHYPVLYGEETAKVWALRQAGLGVLSNIPGDAKPIPVVEDTAVDVQDLPAYIEEFTSHLKSAYNLECVHYAHAGSGEIHLRPILNLKTEEGNRLFRQVADDIATLVKKYGGSLSGEHGDGRLRGEFLEKMIGSHNYKLVCKIKEIWDPHNLLNPKKIVDTPPMNTSLRYEPGAKSKAVETIFDYGEWGGALQMAELCNGSGDCRKTQLTGGTMCPSYMATRDETDTTRARANILRHILSNPPNPKQPFDSEEIKDVLDLCLSCKGCKRECPSNVDMGKLKAEFQQGYYDANGVPLRARMIANFSRLNQLASLAPWAYNFVTSNKVTSSLMKAFSGFAQGRSLPKLHSETLENWFNRHEPHPSAGSKGKVYLFCDEFTNYNDTPVGIAAVELLERLGYEVIIPRHRESARAALSKGMLRQAREIAEENVLLLSNVVSQEIPLVGIEPSAILGFRDEYPDLVRVDYREQARELAEHCLMIDEFLMREVDAGKIRPEVFHDEQRTVRLHGHCHQKALASLTPTMRLLELPANYQVRLIPSGCCGMAGSFGYEEEHFDLSMQIGELVLFPTVRQEPEDSLIAAPGTSCRHQIWDGTKRKAKHPVEILREALVI